MHGQPFDRNLSLQIDILHFTLDDCRRRRGWAWTLYRWWLRLRLRQLEAKIPR